MNQRGRTLHDTRGALDRSLRPQGPRLWGTQPQFGHDNRDVLLCVVFFFGDAL